MEVRRVQGSDLILNCVYDIYNNEENKRIGICLVISKNNMNIKLKKLERFGQTLKIDESEIYGKKPVDLTKADLTDADLTKADLTGAILTRAILTYANLTKADLTGANLTEAKLTEAILTEAILTEANLTEAKLTDADLTEANLTKADLTKADLIRAILTEANLTEAELIKADLTLANLTGAKLNNTNLTRAILEMATLRNAILTGANLTRAFLTNAILTEADLTRAILEMATLRNAILTGAILTGANLTDAILTGAFLTNAILTGANLSDALLSGATIYRDSLSDEQLNQIIGEPREPIQPQAQAQAQAQEYFNINKELSNGNRISLSTGKILINSNVTTQHRISFTRLLDFLLQEENQAKIARRIRIGGEKGEEGIDMGGITLIIFQKCYEAFMERYFYPYEEEDNSNYVVLKDLTDEQFEEFKKACAFMILLAKKVENHLGQTFQILIPINFLLFEVLIFEGNPETFFELRNKNKFFGKRESGKYSNQHKLNNPYNYIAKNSINNNKNNFSIQRIYEGKYNNNQNSTQEFIAKNRINNNENNFSIQRMYEGKYNNNNPKKFNNFEDSEQQKLMFLMLLKQNHIHKRKQYETMKKFIDKIFKPNKDMFITFIDYSYNAFVKRLKFKLSSESRNLNLESFEDLDIASNPLIKLLLDYIKISDEYRMVMTAYVCGSYCYTGDIKILIFTDPSIFPFQSRTCFKELHVYIKPENPRAFNWLKNEPTNSNYSIKGLYNVFLDRTTQIA